MSLLQMSFYGAVLIVMIVILRAIARHRLPKKVFIILWSIALLRLLIPVSVPSEFSLYSILPVDILVQDMVPVADNTSSEKTTLPVPNPVVSTDVPTVQVTGISNGNGRFVPLPTVFWLLGTIGVSLFFCIAYLRCRREFATSLPIENKTVLSWQASHPLKWAYEIRQSDRITAPLTYGILHPVILLPKSMDYEEEQQLHYVLLHEHTHIRHLDTLTKLFIILTVCLHWFNPLVWVMYLLFNRDIEFFCDECVLSSEEEDTRSSYANTLIHMEEAASLSMPLCNHFSKNAIEERIASIMKSKKTTFGMILAGAFIVIVFSVTLFTSPKTVYGNRSIPSLPTPTVTPTPTPGPVVTLFPTATPPLQPFAAPTVTPEEAITQNIRLTSGELYDLAVMIFEQFRQTMNDAVYQWTYYSETYELTVWLHTENHLSIDYQFIASDGRLLESGVLSLYKTDGIWRVAAFLPDTAGE